MPHKITGYGWNAEVLYGCKFVKARQELGLCGVELIDAEGKTRLLVCEHEQDCCESVGLEKIEGEWPEPGYTLVHIAHDTDHEAPKGAYAGDSYTNTTYTFQFKKSARSKKVHEVKLKFVGSSNGYYSENVDLQEWA